MGGAFLPGLFLASSRGVHPHTGVERRQVQAAAVLPHIPLHLRGPTDCALSGMPARSVLLFRHSAKRVEFILALISLQVLENSGPANDRHYRVGVFFKDVKLAEGLGRTVQAAQMEAAKKALEQHNGTSIHPFIPPYPTCQPTPCNALLLSFCRKL